MTNPGNIVRVRARNGGRASVYEANGWAQQYSSGLLAGNGVKQNTIADMNVLVGGSSTKPDVLLAENPAGYKIALDLVGQQALTITAPASNSRISAVVAYTDDLSLPTTEDTVTGSPASCGLIIVNGTAAANPTAPTDAQIRTAITSDGATGSQAAYCIIAKILVSSDTTAIENSLITTNIASLGSQIFNIFYPVGSYYETSDTSFDPNVSWGGTWVEDTAGKVLVSYDNGDADFGTVGGTGGEKTHKLTTTEMPNHSHNMYRSGFESVAQGSFTSSITGTAQATGTTAGAGGGGAHNNLQPYIVVKRWHRTA